MSDIIIRAEAEIAAPAAQVYDVFADYHGGHNDILPKPEFERMDVLSGGYGAGTHIRLVMRLAGQRHEFEQTVTEPEPGRVLVEANTNGSGETTFTIEPLGVDRCHVTIATQMRPASGVRGLVERVLMPRLLRPIYHRELANLAAYVRSTAGQKAAGT